jgi:hypothetical protein
MKFCKHLDKIKEKYSYAIPVDKWFEYKKIKKVLKKAKYILENKLMQQMSMMEMIVAACVLKMVS